MMELFLLYKHSLRAKHLKIKEMNILVKHEVRGQRSVYDLANSKTYRLSYSQELISLLSLSLFLFFLIFYF